MEIISIRNNLINNLIKRLDKSLKIIKHINKIDNAIHSKLLGGAVERFDKVDTRKEIYKPEKILSRCKIIFNKLKVNEDSDSVSTLQFFRAFIKDKQLIKLFGLPKIDKDYIQETDFRSKAQAIFNEIDVDNDKHISWENFEKYCLENIFHHNSHTFTPKSTDELISMSEDHAENTIDQKDISVDEKISIALVNAKKYISTANVLAGKVKKRFDNGERFTKYDCGLNQEGNPSDPDLCQKKTLEYLASLNNSINEKIDL